MKPEKIALLSVVLQYDRSPESIAAILNEMFRGWGYGAREDEYILLEQISKNISTEARKVMYSFCPGPTA